MGEQHRRAELGSGGTAGQRVGEVQRGGPADDEMRRARGSVVVARVEQCDVELSSAAGGVPVTVDPTT